MCTSRWIVTMLALRIEQEVKGSKRWQEHRQMGGDSGGTGGRSVLPCRRAQSSLGSGCPGRVARRNVGATVCCPGPLATGLDGKTRIVYGSSGLISQASGPGPFGLGC